MTPNAEDRLAGRFLDLVPGIREEQTRERTGFYEREEGDEGHTSEA